MTYGLMSLVMVTMCLNLVTLVYGAGFYYVRDMLTGTIIMTGGGLSLAVMMYLYWRLL